MNMFRTTSLALILAAGFGGSVLADGAKPATPAKPAPAPAKDAKPAPAKDAPKGDTASDADVQPFIVWFDKFVDITVADKDDCGKMATDLNAHIDGNKELLAKAKAASDAGKQLPEAAKNHMMESAKKMMGSMQKCGNDKGVMAAIQKLPKKKG